MESDRIDAATLATATGTATPLMKMESAKSESQMRKNLRRFLVNNRLNLIGVIIVGMFLFLAVFGELLAPHDPYAADITNSKLLGPSLSHPMGTDELGRDLLSRIMTGTRISVQVALIVLGFAVTFGTIVGLIAGYWGGWVDEVLMRLTDMFLAFPALILAVAIAASLGRNLRNTMIALATVFWPWYARLVRAQVLSIKEREFVQAAHSIGLSQLAHSASPHLAKCGLGHHHPAHAGRRFRDPSHQLVELHRVGSATSIPRMGHDDVDRPQLLPRRVVVYGVPGVGADVDRAGVQSAGRRPAGRTRSAVRPSMSHWRRSRRAAAVPLEARQ